MRNVGLEEAQAEIKIAGRNINNLRYTEDTILMVESEEELKGLLMKVSLALSFLPSPTLTTIRDYWKNCSLTGWTFVGKVMSLLFNMPSRLVTAFLPWSKRLLILWLQSPSTVILEPNCFDCFPIYLP